MYIEEIDVCSEIPTKHTIALCGKILEFLNVKPGDVTRL
jgi:hypothetical protein